jgi:MoaA/NifB/PqqE/SkfB family radical SAM enzyme
VILTLHCQHDPQPDGSYRLRPERLPPPCVTAAPFLVTGSLARFWEIAVDIAGRPPEEQELLLSDLPPRALSTLSKLERIGVLAVALRRCPDLPLPLDMIHMEITNRCNLACRACYLGPARKPAHGAGAIAEASTAQWTRAIGEAAELGCREVVVTGGEPFVRKDILEIVATLQRHGIRCVINTNASLISDAIARQILDRGVWAVDASVYGFDGVSAGRYTGVPGGHEAALNGIRRLAAQGVRVRAKYFAAEGVHGYDAVRRELEPLGVQVILNTERIHGDVFTGLRPREVQARPEPPVFVQETALPCTSGKTCLHIGPTGEARPCTKLGGVTLGDAFTDGLAAVWHSAAAESFRRFWIRYCTDAGFVRGARVRTSCPASDMLSRPDGLAGFNSRWRAWLDGVAS